MKNVIITLTLLLSLWVPTPALADDPWTDARDWLQARLSSSGFDNPSPSTSQALANWRAGQALLDVDSPEAGQLRAMLGSDAQPLAARTSAELAWRWRLQRALSTDTSATVGQLLDRQQSNGGFAKYDKGDSELVATIAALEAMLEVRQAHPDAFRRAISWLINQRHSDGLWHSGYPLKPSPFLSSRAGRLLHAVRAEWAVDNLLTQLDTALRGLQDSASGGWASSLDTAAVAIYGAERPQSGLLSPATTQALENAQQADGGFDNAVYTTAWALMALKRASEPTPPAEELSSLRASVISADTEQPLPGVSVVLDGSGGRWQTTTNNAGGFQFQDIASGDYALTLTLANHADFQAPVSLPGGRSVDAGTIQLFQAQQSATFVVRGQVTEQGSGAPIEGVRISAAGTEVLTDDQGLYQMLGLLPGNVELLAESPGHYARAATINGEAGMVVDFSPELTRGQPTETGSILRGIVRDAETDQELSGVTVSVTGANTLNLASDSTGDYEGILPNLGEVEVLYEATGYHSVKWYTTVCRGGLIEVHPRMSPVSGPVADVAGLMGRTVDAANEQLIPGAALTITTRDETLLAQSDSDAAFLVSGLNADTAQVLIEADGYHSLELNIGLNPYRTRDLGDIKLRPIKVDTYLPDLAVSQSTRTRTDKNNFSFDNTIEVTINNRGSRHMDTPFSVLAYIDAAENNRFDPSIDTIVGQGRIRRPLSIGEDATISLSLDGVAAFRDAPVKIWVDSDNEVVEISEDNNHDTTARACAIEPAPLSERGIRERWRWSGWSEDDRVANVATTPLVIQLTDDNADGQINQRDIPDIVFVAGDLRSDSRPQETRLVALSGDTGEELWVVDYDLSHYVQLAAADINKDQKVEIVGITKTRSALVAVQNDGALLWSTPISGPPRPKPLGGPPIWVSDYLSITNLEGDSEAEIIYGNRIYRGIDGTMLWQGNRDQGGFWGGYDGIDPLPVGDGFQAFAADLNLDGDKQVLAGRTLYDRLGNVIWHRDDLGRQMCDAAMPKRCSWQSGLNALANLDDDDFAEIVMIIDGTLRALNHDGTDLWGPIDLPDREAGDVAIADLTGDGRSEILVSQNSVLQVYRDNGDLLWTADIHDPTGWTSVSVADLNGNGFLEVVHLDEEVFRVLDGATGVEHFNVRNTSMTISEYPVIADVTGDLQANIIVPGNNRTSLPAGTPGVRVYEANNGRWASARGLWNQHHYSINHIEDDGAVPVTETPSWLTHNTFRGAQQGKNPAALPDITLGRVELIDNGTSIALTARVGNAGLVSPHDLPALELYDGDPEAGGTRIAYQVLDGLEPGAFVDVRIDNLPLTLQNSDLFIWVNRTQSRDECAAANNVEQRPYFAQKSLGTVSLSALPAEATLGEAFSLQSTIENTGRLTAQFRLRYHLLDGNGQPGANALRGVSLNPLASAARTNDGWDWQPSGLVAGEHRIAVQLLGQGGEVLDQDETMVQLNDPDSDLPLAGLNVITDQTRYWQDDQVNIALTALNRHSNRTLNNAVVDLTVLDPQGGTVATRRLLLGTLQAGEQTSQSTAVTLSAAPIGGYDIQATLSTASDGDLADAGSGFEVIDELRLAGEMRVLWQDEEPVCLSTLSNRSATAASDLPVRRRLLDAANEAEVAELMQTMDLAGGESISMQRSYADLDEGDYLCTLEAQQNGQWQPLAVDDFQVSDDSQPPPPPAMLTLELLGASVLNEPAGSTRLAVSLNEAPTADVRVTLAPSISSAIAMASSTLTFTPGNWAQVQEVSAEIIDDDVRSGERDITLRATSESTEARFDALNSADVVLTLRDDEQPELLVTPTSLNSFEEPGAEQRLQVRLRYRPLAPVTVQATVDNDHFELSTEQWTFDASNWDQPQPLWVSLTDVPLFQMQDATLQVATGNTSDTGYQNLQAAPINLVAPANHIEPIKVPVGRFTPWALILLILLSVAIWQRSARNA